MFTLIFTVRLPLQSSNTFKNTNYVITTMLNIENGNTFFMLYFLRYVFWIFFNKTKKKLWIAV